VFDNGPAIVLFSFEVRSIRRNIGKP